MDTEKLESDRLCGLMEWYQLLQQPGALCSCAYYEQCGWEELAHLCKRSL